MILRHEINLITIAYTSTGTVNANEIVQLDTTKYGGTVTYYFEAVYSGAASNTGTLKLRRGTTDDASIAGATSSTVTISRVAFTPPAGQTEYFARLVGDAVRSQTLKAARIVIIENNPKPVYSEEQIEIGDNFSTTSSTNVALSHPKYWKYNAANWGLSLFYFEAVFKCASSKSVTTVTLQQADGSGDGFVNWTDVGSAALTTTGTVATRVRSTAITLTDGRNYRVVIKSGTTKSAANIYCAKIIVNTAAEFKSDWPTPNENWIAQCIAPNGDIYIASALTVYRQRRGSGAWEAQTGFGGSNNFNGLCAAPNGNIYTCLISGDIYMQTGGEGNFNALGQTSRVWSGMAAAPNGDIYCAVNAIGAGDIYKQTGGTGNFVALSQTGREWYRMGAMPNGDIWASDATGNDTYKQTGGAGNFVAQGTPSPGKLMSGFAGRSNGDVYALAVGSAGGELYIRLGGTGNFIGTGQTNRNWEGVDIAPNGDLYSVVSASDLYVHRVIEKLEKQYLLANTLLAAGTALQTFLTKWDSTEWYQVANTYKHVVDAANGSTSVVELDTAAGTQIAGSPVSSPDNQGTSTITLMPANGNLDMKATTNNSDVYASRLLAVVVITPLGKPIIIGQARNRGATI